MAKLKIFGADYSEITLQVELHEVLSGENAKVSISFTAELGYQVFDFEIHWADLELLSLVDLGALFFESANSSYMLPAGQGTLRSMASRAIHSRFFSAYIGRNRNSRRRGELMVGIYLYSDEPADIVSVSCEAVGFTCFRDDAIRFGHELYSEADALHDKLFATWRQHVE